MTTTKPRARKRSSSSHGPKGDGPKVDTFEIMTAEFVRLMKEGAADPKGWSMPWTKFGLDIPRNGRTGKLYKRGNVVRLGMASLVTGHRAVWATQAMWLQLGCTVEKGVGHHPAWIQFWAPRKDDKAKADADAPDAPDAPADGDDAAAPRKRRAWINRVYKVFSIDQVVDLEGHDGARQAVIDRWLPEIEEDPNLRFDIAEELFSAEGMPEIRWGGDESKYVPALDQILMPEAGQFKTRDGFYSTRFHEVIHWTGAKDRLNRPGVAEFDAFGSKQYAFEELVAELGAAFGCQVLGITLEPRLDNAQYLNHWLEILGEDPRALSRAASQAQTAMEYVLNIAGFDLVDEEVDDDAEEAEAA